MALPVVLLVVPLVTIGAGVRFSRTPVALLRTGAPCRGPQGAARFTTKVKELSVTEDPEDKPPLIFSGDAYNPRCARNPQRPRAAF